jgi:hypothetical protein
VIDVAECLVEQRGDMRVEQAVDHLAPSSSANDESKVSEYSQLVGDGGLLHLQLCAEVTNGAVPGAQAGQDSDPAGRRERTHQTSDVLGRLLGERTANSGVRGRSHAHMLACAYQDVKALQISSSNRNISLLRPGRISHTVPNTR